MKAIINHSNGVIKMHTFKDYFNVMNACHEVRNLWVKDEPDREAWITHRTVKTNILEPDCDIEEIEIHLGLKPSDHLVHCIETLGALREPTLFEEFFIRNPDLEEIHREGIIRVFKFKEANIHIAVSMEFDIFATEQQTSFGYRK